MVIGAVGYFGYQQYLSQTAKPPAPVVQPTSQPKVTKTNPPSASPSANLSSKLEDQAYVNARGNFKIRPPKGWKKTESAQGAIYVVFSNPDDPGTTINVTSEVTTMDLATYLDVNKKQLPKVLTNYTPNPDRKVTVNNLDGYIIGGTFVQGQSKLQDEQLVVVKAGQAYVVTAGTLQDNWNKYQDLFDQTLMSFMVQ